MKRSGDEHPGPDEAVAPVELTIKALLLGVVLAMILGAANAYLGLFAGMTVSASIPAAVVSMGVLRLFRRRSIHENNIVQTAASAGEALAAGVIFTLPALVMMGAWTEFGYLEVTVVAGLGGTLGVLLTVPLRRLLVASGRLRFPEGVATAEVLKVGQRGARGIWDLGLAAAAGALFKLGEAGLRLWAAALEGAATAGGWLLYAGANLSPALLAVGAIVGLNISILVFAGGAISWWVAIPILGLVEGLPEGAGPTAEAASILWSTRIRYLGVGAMVVGGLYALANMRQAVLAAAASGLSALRVRAPAECRQPRCERDMPVRLALAGVLVLIVPIGLLYRTVVGSFGATLVMTVLMVAAAFLFAAVAAYMAGLVGSSNNPISGLTIATVLLSGGLLLLVGGRSMSGGPAAAIMIGAVVCCAAAISGDNMQDLKTGHIIGATPWRQQVAQIVGVVAAALVMSPILVLLHRAYGFGARTPDHPRALSAPQASLMESVARGVFSGELPWDLIGVGAALAAAVIGFDRWLQARRSAFRAPVLAVAVGLYLPMGLSVPILAGGLLAHLAGRALAARGPAAIQAGGQRILLAASGLITGEALVGIALALPIVLSGDLDVLAIAAEPLGGWPGLALLAVIAGGLWRVALRPETER